MTDSTDLDIDHLHTLPAEWDTSLLTDIREKFHGADYKIIVLDDDPTGTQTVRDLPVLTSWSVESIIGELESDYPALFILTNSRAMSERRACALAVEIGKNIRAASDVAGIRCVVISRSDSTLRGHFPAEVDAVAAELGKDNLPYLLIPFFLEGGRYTLGDTHYVKENDKLIPAALTPFARDAAFGFSNSDLKKWVEEKTAGRIPETEVQSLSITDIRKGGPERAAEVLRTVKPGQACIVNAASYRDMEVVVSGLQKIEEEGCEFLFRTAASFVRTRTGLDKSEGLLTKEELLCDSEYGGLFVIGSYVEKTSRQLEILFETTDIVPIEVRVEELLAPLRRDIEIGTVVAKAKENLLAGKDAAVYTSRKLHSSDDAEKSLGMGAVVSGSLVRIVKEISVQPRYLVAKGGITSSDIATEALGIRRAMVLGQAQPGVPAWKLGGETVYPGMSYIIFPGNVGEDDALARLQQSLA